MSQETEGEFGTVEGEVIVPKQGPQAGRGRSVRAQVERLPFVAAPSSPRLVTFWPCWPFAHLSKEQLEVGGCLLCH